MPFAQILLRRAAWLITALCLVTAANLFSSPAIHAQTVPTGVSGAVYDGGTGGALAAHIVELHPGSMGTVLEAEAVPAQIDTLDEFGSFSFRFTSESELVKTSLFFRTQVHDPGIIRLRSPDGDLVAEWTARYSSEDFSSDYVLTQDIHVYLDLPRTDAPALAQFYFLEKPVEVHPAGKVVVLLHGLSGTSGYWSTLPGRLEALGYDVWRLYYPNSQQILDSAVLLGKALDLVLGLYPGRDKVDLVTHSMGGLVARAYTVWDEDRDDVPDLYGNDISKLLMMGPPHYGAEIAAKVNRGESVAQYVGSLGLKPTDPALRDMCPGSRFVWEVDRCGVNTEVEQLVIAGTNAWSDIVLRSVYVEAEGHSDGFVTISSASLLTHSIPLALLDLDHTEQIGKVGSSQTWLDAQDARVTRVTDAINGYLSGETAGLFDAYFAPSDSIDAGYSAADLTQGGLQLKLVEANGDTVGGTFSLEHADGSGVLPLMRDTESGFYYGRSADEAPILPAGTYTVRQSDTQEAVMEVAILPSRTTMATHQLQGTEPSSDFDGSGKVDFQDFLLLARVYGKKLADEGYDPVCDLDSDGEVGFKDFLIFARKYSEG